jgi:hypothetical protein
MLNKIKGKMLYYINLYDKYYGINRRKREMGLLGKKKAEEAPKKDEKAVKKKLSKKCRKKNP